MRFKRMIALLCAAIYLTTAGAAAAEPLAETGETVVSEAAESAEIQDSAVRGTEMPTVRASGEIAAPSVHKVQVNGKAVNPEVYLIGGYNYFKLRDIAYMLNETSASFNVTWDGAQNAVNLLLGQRYTAVGGEMAAAAVSVQRAYPSSAKVLLDGSGISIKGYSINGNNYYKIADVANAVGFIAAYESAARTVQIKTADTAQPEEPSEPFVTGIYQVVVDSTLSIRSGPGTTYDMVGQLSNGDRIVVDSISNGWARIRGTERYCSMDYLTRVGDYNGDWQSPETPEPPSEPFVTGVYRVVVDSTLSIRSGPGTTYAIVGRLSNGDQITVDSISNGWAHILDEDGSASQYCSMDYLTRVGDYEEPEPEEPEKPEEPFVAGVYRVEVDSTLSVRSDAGTKYPIVGRLSDSDEIVVDEMTEDDDGKRWAHLMDTSKGTGRYCSAEYLVRVRDYDAGEGEPDDPVEPPRTSHLDGVRTVIVDAGHGGSDIGAHNEDMSLDEKHVNLYVAQYLQQYLEDAGVRVIMVRDTLEDGSSLSMRGQVMERYAASADLFFSIHHNAANTTARGAEVLAQIADRNGGPTQILGEALLEEYDELGIPIRSVVFREGSNGDYYYTNRAAAALFIPALTSEFCFIDNEEDQKFIDSEEDWQAEAKAQYNAIMYYFTQVEY